MRRMRFLAVALISFVVTLFGAFVSPSTWLHKSLAFALCGLLSANPALCTNNAIVATQSQEASATNPVKGETTLPNSLNSLQSHRSREFDSESIASNLPISNPSRSTETIDKTTNNIISQQSTPSVQYIRDEFKSPIYTYYVNGIRTDNTGYADDVNLLSSRLLNGVVEPPVIDLPTHNPTGIISQVTAAGDLFESLRQTLDAPRPDSEKITNTILEAIKKRDKEKKEEAKLTCEDKKRAKFLIIGHSQGNFFMQDVAQKLPQEFADRTVLLSFASFTNFGRISSRIRAFYPLLRPDDLPVVAINNPLDPKKIPIINPITNALLKKIISIPSGTPNIPPLPSLISYQKKPSLYVNGSPVKLDQVLDSHKLSNYLGNPSHPDYASNAQRSLEMARANLGALLNFDSGNYEKKEDCPKRDKKTGSSYGDPHIVTFDGYRYSFQTVGEFTLVKSTDGSFEVQVRQSPVPGSQVSLNSAVAIKSGNSRIAIYGQSLPDSDTSTTIRVDGRPFPAQGGTLPNGTIIAQQGQGSYIIQTTSGEVVSVRKTSRNNLSYMDVNPSIPDIAGRYLGLLGNSNGNPKDDLQTRNGQVIETQSTYGQIAQTASSIIPGVGRITGLVSKVENIVFDQLYKEFGNSWRISQTASLFDYKAGQNTNTFTDRGFPSSYRTLAMLTPAQVQTANAACQQAKVNPDQLEGCIFDVGFTGDTGFAETASQALEIINTINQIIPNAIPLPQVPQLPIPFKIPGLPF